MKRVRRAVVGRYNGRSAQLPKVATLPTPAVLGWLPAPSDSAQASYRARGNRNISSPDYRRYNTGMLRCIYVSERHSPDSGLSSIPNSVGESANHCRDNPS